MTTTTSTIQQSATSTIQQSARTRLGTKALTAVRRLLAGAAMFALLVPSAVDAAGVRPLFDLDSATTGPFPSDRFTVRIRTS